jgi:hypothetical protein
VAGRLCRHINIRERSLGHLLIDRVGGRDVCGCRQKETQEREQAKAEAPEVPASPVTEIRPPKAVYAFGQRYVGSSLPSVSCATQQQQRRQAKRREEERQEYERAGQPPTAYVVVGLVLLIGLLAVFALLQWTDAVWLTVIFIGMLLWGWHDSIRDAKKTRQDRIDKAHFASVQARLDALNQPEKPKAERPVLQPKASPLWGKN